MNRKKFTRAAKIATASLVAFTMTTSPVFAATGDLWKGTTNKGSVAQMILGGSAGRLDFATSMDQYTYEVDGVGYAVGEVDTMFKANPTLSTAEVQAKVKAELTGTPVSDELVVESVSAITNTVNKAVDQQLEFAINGETEAADVAALVEAGYTVAFEATVLVTATGVVDASAMTTPFEYKVIVKDAEGTIVAESELVEVKVADYSAVTTEITKAELTLANTVVVKSGKIALGDVATFTTLEGTRKDGTKEDPLTTVKFKSSNTSVAVIGLDGKITPIQPGNVVFTLTDGDATLEVPMTIVAETRKESVATADVTEIKLINSGTATVNLVVKDQYGDTFAGYDSAVIDVKTAATPAVTIATTSDPAVTTADGKTSFVVTADTTAVGSANLKVVSGTKTLMSIPVTVGAEGSVANRKVELVDATKDFTLDIISGTADDSVDVVWNRYNAEGLLMGPEVDWVGNSATNPETYTVESNNDDIATAAVADDGTITVSAGTETGIATVSIKQGSVTRASFAITVVDTTPSITGVTFESDLTMKGNTTDFALVKLLKAANVTINGEGTVTIDADGKIMVGAIEIGAIALVSNVTDSTGATARAVSITTGNIVVTSGAATDKGEIIVKVIRAGETVPVATTVITVQ